MSFTHCKQITKATSSDICYSIFEFLYYDYGSAIFVSSQSWHLKADRCLFRYCISNNEGGAIKVNVKAFEMTRSCFETCFISLSSNDVFGNAVFTESNSANSKAYLNFSTFLCCGPKITISADSTIYFYNMVLFASSLNFSQCFSYMGASAITISQGSGSASFIELREGKSNHISCNFGTKTLGFSSSNFIDWTPNANDQIFWTRNGRTSLNKCYIFIYNPTYNFGMNVDLIGPCYGNVGGKVTKTETTMFPLENIMAGNCQDIACNQNCNVSSAMSKSLILMLQFFHRSAFIRN